MNRVVASTALLCTLLAPALSGCSKDATGNPPGGTCTQGSDCASGRCENGVCLAALEDGAVADPGDTGVSSDLDGSIDTPDTGPFICLAPNEECTPGGTVCCTGLCQFGDAGMGTCAEASLCALEGAPCSEATDCCSLGCIAGKCGTACKPVESACAGPTDCCSGLCTGGACATLPGASCKNLGETCAAPLDCCSQNCQAGVCTRASFCSAANDICYANADCCNGTCNLPAADGPGRCAAALTAPGASNCVIGGEPCVDSGSCCSHLCLDLGTGMPSCVLGSGCRERGEICRESAECCGVSNSGVFCSKEVGAEFGRCSNKQSCQPVGNCCGAFGDSCPQNCCEGQKEVCKKDEAGLSRCFGGYDKASCPSGWTGEDPCCIAEGASCQFSDQCCDDTPCVAEGTVYVCRAPQCVSVGTLCNPLETDPNKRCCDGLACLPNGEIDYVCRAGEQPQPGRDAGVVDPGYDAGELGYDAGPPIEADAGWTCERNGQACSDASSCCSGLCIGGVCSGCRVLGGDCAAALECCSGVCTGGKCADPFSCVSQFGVCSGTSDCCPGTYCDIAPGAPNGTCQVGSVCSSAGQGCTDTQPCCVGLSCQNAVGALCAAGDPRCTCRLDVN